MFKIQVDPVPVVNALHQAGQRAGYAIASGLNQLANKAQAAERAHMAKAFNLRREQFNLRAIYISKADRADATTWRVVIQVKLPGNRHHLQDHEGGQVRVPHGGKFLWQPNQDVFKSKIIGSGNSLAPKNLNLRRGKGGTLQGDHRTFLIKTNGQRFILQRQGRRQGGTVRGRDEAGRYTIRKRRRNSKGNGQTRLLYRLVQRVKLPARLAFVTTITRTVQDQWGATIGQAVMRVTGGLQ